MLTGTIHNIRKTLVEGRNALTTRHSLELEAKFGTYNNGRFDTYVPYVYFERLLNTVKELPEVTAKTTEISTVSSGARIGNYSIRQLVTVVPGDGKEEVLWQRKTNIENFDIFKSNDYDIRISANVEETIEPPVNFVIENTRERTRHSFSFGNQVMRLDLTEVIMTGADRVARPTYEVELEFLGTIDELPFFEREIEVIYKLLRGTHLLYTTSILNTVISDMQKILGDYDDTNTKKRDTNIKKRDPNNIDKRLLVEARNIKKRDIVYGGIVGNNMLNEAEVLATNSRRPNRNGNGTSYMVTYKADGFRKLLIIHSTGIWLIYPPYEFNLVMDAKQFTGNLAQLTQIFNGTVLDGELVTPRIGKPTTYYYLAFDCLVSPVANRANKGSYIPSRSVQNSPYTGRREIVDTIAGALKNATLIVDTKETYELTNPERFFSIVSAMLNKRDKLDYQEDGLIFIPTDCIYNPRSQRHPLSNRKLTEIPDVVKLKQAKDITIDFTIKWLEGNRIELMAYDKDSDALVPFRGSDINPVTPDMIDSTSPVLYVSGTPLPTGSIVEFEWSGDKLRARKWRPDKQRGNSLEIALDDWEDIMNPVSYDFVTGRSLGLSYEYHKRIKRVLFESLTKSLVTNGQTKPVVTNVQTKAVGVNVLDIGTGRGGDIARMRSLATDNTTGFIVAVEPNSDNREDLLERIQTFDMTNKILVVPTGGEDTVAITTAVQRFIPGGKVDVVTLMLSMSFFWATDSHLNALIRTITTNLKPGGRIMFLTIDGDTVEQLFEPALSTDWISDKQIADAKLHLHEQSLPPYGRALDINLPGTIVGQQREYLVHLNDFTSRLAEYGIELQELHRAEGELLLSEPNKLYSSLFSFGTYTNTTPQLLLKMQQDNSPVSNIELIPIPENLFDVNLPVISNDTNMNYPPVAPISPNRTPMTITAVAPVPELGPSPGIGTIVKPIIAPVTAPRGPNTAKPNKYMIDKNQLRWLTVSYVGADGRVIIGPVNDDTYAPLKSTWYNNLVRIATIGDGNCFIHALLKSYYKQYQDNNDARYRLNTSSVIRRDLASMLSASNPAYPGRSYWLTAGNGGFPRLVMQQMMDETLVGYLNLDYSLNGLQRLFNSTVQLGDEVYSYVSDVLDIDIYILRATTQDLYPHLHTRRPGRLRNGVVIVGNSYHYEVLAIDTTNGLQTVFLPADPFIESLTKLFIGDGAFTDIYNAQQFDPDQEFINNAIETFGGPDNYQTPANLNIIFLKEDEFVITYNRLLPQIQQRVRQLAMTNQIAPTVETTPLARQFDTILETLTTSDFNVERLVTLRELFMSHIFPGGPLTVDGIIASLFTDGLISQEEAEAIELSRI